MFSTTPLASLKSPSAVLDWTRIPCQSGEAEKAIAVPRAAFLWWLVPENSGPLDKRWQGFPPTLFDCAFIFLLCSSLFVLFCFLALLKCKQQSKNLHSRGIYLFANNVERAPPFQPQGEIGFPVQGRVISFKRGGTLLARSLRKSPHRVDERTMPCPTWSCHFPYSKRPSFLQGNWSRDMCTYWHFDLTSYHNVTISLNKQAE